MFLFRASTPPIARQLLTGQGCSSSHGSVSSASFFTRSRFPLPSSRLTEHTKRQCRARKNEKYANTSQDRMPNGMIIDAQIVSHRLSFPFSRRAVGSGRGLYGRGASRLCRVHAVMGRGTPMIRIFRGVSAATEDNPSCKSAYVFKGHVCAPSKSNKARKEKGHARKFSVSGA